LTRSASSWVIAVAFSLSAENDGVNLVEADVFPAERSDMGEQSLEEYLETAWRASESL